MSSIADALPPGSPMTDLRTICAKAIADHRSRQAALNRAGHELERLVAEAQSQNTPITGDRAVQVARLVIGTYHTAIEAHQAEVEASRQGRN